MKPSHTFYRYGEEEPHTRNLDGIPHKEEVGAFIFLGRCLWYDFSQFESNRMVFAAFIGMAGLFSLIQAVIALAIWMVIRLVWLALFSVPSSVEWVAVYFVSAIIETIALFIISGE